MLSQEQELVLSEYSGLYDIVVPQDNLLRRINALIDFSFVYQELVDKYCSDNGRMAESPIRMFKYLLLKVIYDISDVDVVDRSRYDMSFKPKSVFRITRLQNVSKTCQFVSLCYCPTTFLTLKKHPLKSRGLVCNFLIQL